MLRLSERWLRLRLGRCCRSFRFFLLVVRQRLRERHLGHDHAVAVFRVGVCHRHIWLERGPLHRAALRINEHGILRVVILYRSSARFGTERDVVRAGRVSCNRARAAKRTRARGVLARCARRRCGCS